MTDQTSATMAGGRSLDPPSAEGMQALLAGLELTRASQLTMLRLQLALHKANRRSAMQALDDLLDIDAEIEGLAANLAGAPARPTDAAAIAGFIGLQKAAIAVEKHALAGGDRRTDVRPIAIAEPDECARAEASFRPMPAEEIVAIPDQPTADPDLLVAPPAGEGASETRTKRGRWGAGLALVIILALIGISAIAWLWPEWLAPLREAPSRLVAFASGAG